MADHTRYQQKAIKNYYDNQEPIMLQRLGELLTDLYLAEGKARTRLWDRAANALTKLKVPKAQIEKIVATDNPAILANAYQQLLEKK